MDSAANASGPRQVPLISSVLDRLRNEVAISQELANRISQKHGIIRGLGGGTLELTDKVTIAGSPSPPSSPGLCGAIEDIIARLSKANSQSTSALNELDELI